MSAIAAGDMPVSRPGPVVNGQPTTTTLFSPEQFAESKFLPSMQKVANEAYSAAHVKGGYLPSHILRVPTQQYLIDELGDRPGTFTYIIHAGDTDVIGTATMRPFSLLPREELPDITPEQLEKVRRNGTWTRSVGLPPDVQGWELKMMFVSLDAQRQGLADLLMRLCETEAERRSSVAGTDPTKILFMLTCVEELMGAFYKKKGYKEDSKTWQPIGTFESETGFTVLHMSKSISAS